MTDALDDAFGLAEEEPKVKLLPLAMLWSCATGEHKDCRGFGWINSEEGKTYSNAGDKVHVRCSCTCHG